MKTALPLLALFCAAPALADEDDAPVTDAAPLVEPLIELDMSQTTILPPTDRNCTDTLYQAQQGPGSPLFDRDVADADSPILLAAVQYNVDGCDMMLTSDGLIRPLPMVPEGPLRPQPAQ